MNRKDWVKSLRLRLPEAKKKKEAPQKIVLAH